MAGWEAAFWFYYSVYLMESLSLPPSLPLIMIASPTEAFPCNRFRPTHRNVHHVTSIWLPTSKHRIFIYIPAPTLLRGWMVRCLVLCVASLGVYGWRCLIVCVAYSSCLVPFHPAVRLLAEKIWASSEVSRDDMSTFLKSGEAWLKLLWCNVCCLLRWWFVTKLIRIDHQTKYILKLRDQSKQCEGEWLVRPGWDGWDWLERTTMRTTSSIRMWPWPSPSN